MEPKLYRLYTNDKWLQDNGLKSDNKLLIKVGLGFLQAIFESKLPWSPDAGARKIINKLRKRDVGCFDGTIVVESVNNQKVFFFKDNDGMKYPLCPIDDKIGAVGFTFPEILLLGVRTAQSQDGQTQILPVVIYQRKRVRVVPPGRIPVGVAGLSELLFPNHAPEERGFQKPDKNNVVPRLIIVKGAVGTGKTTLATQMMIKMAQKGFCCDYWCSNDRPEAVKKTATSFKFCDEQEYEELRMKTRISVLEIGDDYLKYLKLPKSKQDRISSMVARFGLNRTRSSLSATDVLFLDSLNLSQIKEDVQRQSLWEIFTGYRKLPLLSVFLLEDYRDDGTEDVRQLISDCEFLADVVIELGEETRDGYHTKSIKVKKKHYGQQVHGVHFYKICPVDGALPNMNIDAKRPAQCANTGILVFPSIHRYLSRARVQQYKPFLVNTGITHLDAILLGGSSKKPTIDNGCIESNSCVVVGGERGGHKLPLGLNILMGGMWRIHWKAKVPKVVPDRDVLLILLDEEADIHIDLSATVVNTHLFTDATTVLESLDNGRWIRWMARGHRRHHRGQNCAWSGLFETGVNVGKKVHFDAWCAEIVDETGTPRNCRKLVVAGFRPGCITPEEFIYIVDNLLQPSQSGSLPFSRVLFVSTAHLQNRFPLLGRSELFIPALVDLFKSKNVVSIFIDVKGLGSDERLSYGLAALADYIICVDEFSRDRKYYASCSKKLDENSREKFTRLLRDNNDRYVSSKMHVENVRGKEYSKPFHAVTVRPRWDGKGNELYIVNAREEEALPLIFEMSPGRGGQGD